MRIRIQKPQISKGSIFISSSPNVRTEFLAKGIVEITSIEDLDIVIFALNEIKKRLEKRVSKKGKIRRDNG